MPNLSKICHLEVFKNFILELGWKVNTLVKRLKSGTEECRVVQYLICTFFRPIQIQSFLSFSLELLQCSRATCIINVSLRETSRMHTGVFRRAAQSLVRPWALILGGRLYGASIWVEYHRTGICTCHLTRYVQRYTVLSLNTICSCHLTPVVGKLFLSRHRLPFQ